MANIVVGHGFNVGDGGEGTVGTLIKPLEDAGHKVYRASYGWLGLIGVLFFNRSISSVIAGMNPDNAIGIGHSNACALLVRAAQQGAKYKKLILINPALKADIEFPDTVEEVFVIHNKGDFAVKAAKWLRRAVGFFFPNFLWGEMGNTGYIGTQGKVKNWSRSELVSGHSAVFNERWFKELIVEKVGK